MRRLVPHIGLVFVSLAIPAFMHLWSASLEPWRPETITKRSTFDDVGRQVRDISTRMGHMEQLLIAYGQIGYDSGDANIDTVAVVDSFGDTAVFASQDEWFVMTSLRAHRSLGVDNTGFQCIAKPLNQSEFYLHRTYSTRWDTIMYIAIGKRGRW